jgi:hypothetical protein
MTVGRASAIAAGLMCAMAISVWTGQRLTRHTAADQHDPAPREGPAPVAPVLNSGTNAAGAADGFASAEQFAAAVHAARNINVPFVVLKDRMVTQRKSLATALHELRPDVDALTEADRAFAEARSDLASPAI